jgi:hypothetical protein
MAIKVAICAATLDHPKSGGHQWVYLNWALGLRALGCEVIWLEGVTLGLSPQKLDEHVEILKSYLDRYGLSRAVALYSRSWNGEPIPQVSVPGLLDIEAAFDADLLLNLSYAMPPQLVSRFKRSALVDIDPGLTQIWITAGQFSIAPHDTYFTIGETVGQPTALFPDCGLRWQYTPPAVFLPAWPVAKANGDAPFSTVTGWWDGGRWIVFGAESYSNVKRDGFLPFLQLPKYINQPLELSIPEATGVTEEKQTLLAQGWRINDSFVTSSTPWNYQRYIQNSRGEFSCARPPYIRLQNAWISDRTLCYLGSGKPTIVQHTGPSRFLPDHAGLFRFRDMEGAVSCLQTAVGDYDRHCRLARALAEEYFDAKKVVKRVLEQALT